MPQDRFFLDKDLQKHTSYHLEGEEFHHLYTVMRNQIGDDVELVNGKGSLAVGTITELSKKSATIHIETTTFKEQEPTKIFLAPALVKMSKIELVIEKGTELGITGFYFFTSKHSDQIFVSESKKHRLEKILLSALKQSGRLYLPEMKFFPLIEKIPVANHTLFYGDISEKATILCKSDLDSDSIMFFIGPEKGLTDNETSYLDNIEAKKVRFNRNTLRAETASVAIASIISYLKMLT